MGNFKYIPINQNSISEPTSPSFNIPWHSAIILSIFFYPLLSPIIFHTYFFLRKNLHALKCREPMSVASLYIHNQTFFYPIEKKKNCIVVCLCNPHFFHHTGYFHFLRMFFPPPKDSHCSDLF